MTVAVIQAPDITLHMGQVLPITTWVKRALAYLLKTTNSTQQKSNCYTALVYIGKLMGQF